MRNTRMAWRAWQTYGDAPLTARVFLAARASVLPAGALVDAFRGIRGSVISIGAGHGLAERALALSNPDLTFTGFELDAERVRLGNATNDATPAVVLRNADVRSLPSTETFDAGLACDLFHHLPREDQAGMARELARRIREGGHLVVKDIATTPRWKHSWNRLHDRVVAGDDAQCSSPSEMVEILTTCHFRILRVGRPHRYGPYPHYLITAKRV